MKKIIIPTSLLFCVLLSNVADAQTTTQATLVNEGGNIVEVFGKPSSSTINGIEFDNITFAIGINNNGASNPSLASIIATSLIPSLDIETIITPTDSVVDGSRVYYTYDMTNINSNPSTWVQGADNPIATLQFPVDPTTLNMRLEDLTADGGSVNGSANWYIQIDSGQIVNFANEFYGIGATNVLGGNSFVPLQALILPVNFTGFTVTPGEGDALLNWKASGEGTISKDYEVERSVNGGSSYTTLDTVAITSPNALSNSYNYTDNITALKPVNNTIYYRIKQVDYDGKSTYSLIEDLRLAAPVSTLDLNVYPNPVLDYATVGFNLDADAVATIDVTNVNGQLIQSTQVQGLQGANKASVNFSSLVAGNYMLTLKIGSDAHTTPLIKH